MADDSKIIQKIIDAIPIAIYIKDADSKFAMVNKAFELEWGISFSELQGTNGSTLFPPDFLNRYLSQDSTVVNTRKKNTFQETIWNPRLQEQRIGYTVKQPIYDDKGQLSYLICATVDVTEKLHVNGTQLSEAKLRSLFEMSPLGIARNAMDGSFVEANPAFLNMVGYSLEQLKQLSYWDLTPKRYEAMENEQLSRLHSTGKYGPYEKEYLSSQGRLIPVRLNGVLIADKDGQQYIWSIVEDITDRKRVEEQLNLAALVYQNSSEGILVSDEDNNVISINPAFSLITGYSIDDVAGKNPRIFSSGMHDRAFYQDMWHAINTYGHWQGEMCDRRKNGETHTKWMTINTIKNEEGRVYHYVALFSDITEKKQSEKLIWRQANFDSLTGLPNRRMFQDRLIQEIKKSNRVKLPLALLLIDLDEFKEVNDTLGHEHGDQLLRQAADRISQCVRESDTVARLGGDEFTVILSEQTDRTSAEDVAQKIILSMAEPFTLGMEVVYISASVGITLYPDDARDIEALMKNADQAMYAAKKQGRNRFCYFTRSLQEAAQRRLRMNTDLRNALSEKQFQVYFQPVVDLKTGLICKAEALLRWHHPERGMVSPMEFIPLAEETGLINEIGLWVFKEAARWAKIWSEKYANDFQVSVNKSPIQFKSDMDANSFDWGSYLDEIALAGKNIVVEITEGLLLNIDEKISSKLMRFSEVGIQVAIDDFGTGYSSLSYLKRFDIDYLKIDRSFICGLETDANDMALSEAIIVMAHKLGLKVIAEGVETKKQSDLLMQMGCDYVQGYFYGCPMPPTEMQLMLDHQARRPSTYLENID